MYVTFTFEVIYLFFPLEYTPATKIGYKSIQFDGLNHSLVQPPYTLNMYKSHGAISLLLL